MTIIASARPEATKSARKLASLSWNDTSRLNPRAEVAAAMLPSGAAADADIAAVVDRLSQAERPLVIVGGASWDAEAARALGDFAKTMGLPVGASFRCQDFLDNRHPNYVGDIAIGVNPALAQRVRDEVVRVKAVAPRLERLGAVLAGPALVDVVAQLEQLRLKGVRLLAFGDFK